MARFPLLRGCNVIGTLLVVIPTEGREGAGAAPGGGNRQPEIPRQRSERLKRGECNFHRSFLYITAAPFPDNIAQYPVVDPRATHMTKPEGLQLSGVPSAGFVNELSRVIFGVSSESPIQWVYEYLLDLSPRSPWIHTSRSPLEPTPWNRSPGPDPPLDPPPPDAWRGGREGGILISSNRTGAAAFCVPAHPDSDGASFELFSGGKFP